MSVLMHADDSCVAIFLGLLDWIGWFMYVSNTAPYNNNNNKKKKKASKKPNKIQAGMWIENMLWILWQFQCLGFSFVDSISDSPKRQSYAHSAIKPRQLTHIFPH